MGDADDPFAGVKVIVLPPSCYIETGISKNKFPREGLQKQLESKAPHLSVVLDRNLRREELEIERDKIKLYRKYCFSIIRRAAKGGVLKELVLLLNAFRVMYQLPIENSILDQQEDQQCSEESGQVDGISQNKIR
jgi:hypothetical protein